MSIYRFKTDDDKLLATSMVEGVLERMKTYCLSRIQQGTFTTRQLRTLLDAFDVILEPVIEEPDGYIVLDDDDTQPVEVENLDADI